MGKQIYQQIERILTVRRRNIFFKHLCRFGARTPERKHAVEIDLTAYERDMYPSEARVVYAEKHEELWIGFVEEAVERAGYPELKGMPRLSKTEFAEQIRTLE